jgi:hypothetical protein
MLIRTQKDFQAQHLKESDQCDECHRSLMTLPVIVIEGHRYHGSCAIKLMYAILFAFFGKPELEEKTPDETLSPMAQAFREAARQRQEPSQQ